MDVDVDPFDERDKTDEATGGEDETIPLIPMGGGDSQIDPSGEQETSFGGGATWEPEREHETSFGDPEAPLSGGEILHKEYLVGELYELIGNKIHQRLEPNLRLFKLDKDGRLYYRGKPLMNKNGELKKIGVIADTLGIGGLKDMGYNITKTNLKPRFLLDLLEKQTKLPSASDVTKADEIELKEITDKSITSMDDLIRELSSDQGTQTGEDDPDMPTMRELQGLDKELRSIRGSLKVEAAKKVEIKHKLTQENRKLEYVREHSNYDEGIHKDIKERIGKLTDDLKVREESIDLLKGRLKNQITSFRETIAKVLDKDSTLGERIKTLFREQGITIFSILTAIGMAIGVLVEAVLPGSTASTAAHGGDTSGSAKRWVRNKLRALASLLGKLAEKAGAALPGIIGSVVAWLLNRAKEVVGWISKNLWSLVLLCIWMVYDYMKKPQSVSKKK